MQTIKPLTSAEAESLCQEFGFLAGKTLVIEPTDFFQIEHVVTAPFDELAKTFFATRFLETNNALESISFYHGADFDVVIFARNLSDRQTMLYESLSDYLQHENIDLTNDELPSYVM
jgi:hypothetical protein